MSFQKIPTVDLNDYLHGDQTAKSQFVKALGDSFSGIGFAIVANHGVSEQTISSSYKAFKDFFDLPDETKRKYEISNLAGQRGYTSKGREHAKHTNVGDLKEFYHIGQIIEDDDELKALYPDNLFPKEVPEVEKHGVDYINHLKIQVNISLKQ